MSIRTIGNRVASIASGSLLFGLLVLVWLKSCVVTIWNPPRSVQHYSIVGKDQRTLEVTVFPDREVILWYTVPARQYLEGSLQSWKGTKGTHYLGRLWHIEGPGIDFGYRLYPSGFTPIVIEETVVRSFRSGIAEKPAFPEKGEHGDEVLLFSKDSLVLNRMTLKRSAPDPEQIAMRVSLLGKVGGLPVSSNLGR